VFLLLLLEPVPSPAYRAGTVVSNRSHSVSSERRTMMDPLNASLVS
jgi:hypothetical protein